MNFLRFSFHEFDAMPSKQFYPFNDFQSDPSRVNCSSRVLERRIEFDSS